MFRKITLALLVVGSLWGTVGAARAQSEGDLTWTQHPTLTWDDFRGSPPPSVAYPSALSDTGFKFELECPNEMLDINATAFFSPSGSWVKPDEKTADLLKHEQGHFDMAESYALKLRKSAGDAEISCQDRNQARAAGQQMVAQFQKGWQDAERKYEEDTKYGTDLAQQAAASRRIAADLAALGAYK